MMIGGPFWQSKKNNIKHLVLVMFLVTESVIIRLNGKISGGRS